MNYLQPCNMKHPMSAKQEHCAVLIILQTSQDIVLIAILKIFFKMQAYISIFKHQLSKLEPICTVSLIFAMLSPKQRPQKVTAKVSTPLPPLPLPL